MGPIPDNEDGRVTILAPPLTLEVAIYTTRAGNQSVNAPQLHMRWGNA